MLALSVADTGPGIPEADRERVMQPYVQVGDSGGVGLGLPITRELAALMGGALTLDCPPQGGCIFTMTFRAPAVAPAERRPPPALPGPAVQGLRVLVVDDLPTNRAIAALLLGTEGHRAVEAEDCAEALAALSREPFDAVLMDIRMPGVDGTAALRAIRGAPAPWSDIPVVAMTAEAMPDDRARILAEGFDGYLAKPMDPAALRRALAVLPLPAAGPQSNSSWQSSSASTSASTSARVL
jgi:CheY-like chemotaxis protein